MKGKSSDCHCGDIQQISPEDTSRTCDFVENRLRGRMEWGYVEHVSVSGGTCCDVDHAGDQAAEEKERKNIHIIPPFMSGDACHTG